MMGKFLSDPLEYWKRLRLGPKLFFSRSLSLLLALAYSQYSEIIINLDSTEVTTQGFTRLLKAVFAF